jgi:hypothetical protein
MSLDAIKFDAVRVYYRKERRALVREIIVQQYVGDSMKTYIHSYIDKAIPEKDQAAFLTNVMEDLEQMDYIRIVAFGVTAVELDDWMKKYRSKG